MFVSALRRLVAVSLLRLPPVLLDVDDSGLVFKLVLLLLRVTPSSGVPSLGVAGFEPLLPFTDVGVDLPDDGADLHFLSKFRFRLVPS